jgi:antirestriction protein
MNNNTSAIRIYVADLAAYNDGHLHGVWIDATLELEEIEAQVQAMLAASPVADAEEYAIHDTEGFGEHEICECAGLERARDVALFIAEHPHFGPGLLNHFGDLDEARRTADEGYRGCYASLTDFAQELTEETTQIPEALRHYIDYDSMARDLEMSGDVFTIDAGSGQVHVFWSC